MLSKMKAYTIAKINDVLILVLMEYALEDHLKTKAMTCKQS